MLDIPPPVEELGDLIFYNVFKSRHNELENRRVSQEADVLKKYGDASDDAAADAIKKRLDEIEELCLIRKTEYWERKYNLPRTYDCVGDGVAGKCFNYDYDISTNFKKSLQTYTDSYYKSLNATMVTSLEHEKQRELCLLEIDGKLNSLRSRDTTATDTDVRAALELFDTRKPVLKVTTVLNSQSMKDVSTMLASIASLLANVDFEFERNTTTTSSSSYPSLAAAISLVWEAMDLDRIIRDPDDDDDDTTRQIWRKFCTDKQQTYKRYLPPYELCTPANFKNKRSTMWLSSRSTRTTMDFLRRETQLFLKELLAEIPNLSDELRDTIISGVLKCTKQTLDAYFEPLADAASDDDDSDDDDDDEQEEFVRRRVRLDILEPIFHFVAFKMAWLNYGMTDALGIRKNCQSVLPGAKHQIYLFGPEIERFGDYLMEMSGVPIETTERRTEKTQETATALYRSKRELLLRLIQDSLTINRGDDDGAAANFQVCGSIPNNDAQTLALCIRDAIRQPTPKLRILSNLGDSIDASDKCLLNKNTDDISKIRKERSGQKSSQLQQTFMAANDYSPQLLTNGAQKFKTLVFANHPYPITISLARSNAHNRIVFNRSSSSRSDSELELVSWGDNDSKFMNTATSTEEYDADIAANTGIKSAKIKSILHKMYTKGVLEIKDVRELAVIPVTDFNVDFARADYAKKLLVQALMVHQRFLKSFKSYRWDRIKPKGFRFNENQDRSSIYEVVLRALVILVNKRNFTNSDFFWKWFSEKLIPVELQLLFFKRVTQTPETRVFLKNLRGFKKWLNDDDTDPNVYKYVVTANL